MPVSEPGAQERALARLLLGKTLRVRRGETVTIEAWSHSIPWATACFREATERKAHPIILYHDDATFWALVEGGRAREVGILGEHEYTALANTDAYVYFEGPEDRGRFHALPDATRKLVTAWEDRWWEMAKKAGLRCAWLLLGRAVTGSARFHGIPLGVWREELIRSSLVDPSIMRREGLRVARRFTTGRAVRIQHPNGTRLDLRLGGRAPIVHDGVVDEADLAAGHFLEEVPSGYVPVLLDETFAEGRIFSNVTHRGLDGHTVVSGAHWEFHAGRLTGFHHERGGSFLAQEYSSAPPEGRDRPALLSIGLNPEISRAPIVTDQRRGRLMLMVGGNKGHGGGNANPFHTYLLLDGASVDVDGVPLLVDGKIA